MSVQRKSAIEALRAHMVGHDAEWRTRYETRLAHERAQRQLREERLKAEADALIDQLLSRAVTEPWLSQWQGFPYFGGLGVRLRISHLDDMDISAPDFSALLPHIRAILQEENFDVTLVPLDGLWLEYRGPTTPAPAPVNGSAPEQEKQ